MLSPGFVVTVSPPGVDVTMSSINIDTTTTHKRREDTTTSNKTNSSQFITQGVYLNCNLLLMYIHKVITITC